MIQGWVVSNAWSVTVSSEAFMHLDLVLSTGRHPGFRFVFLLYLQSSINKNVSSLWTHHFWYLAVRKPLKTSARDATWCRLSRMTTEGSALADVASHWSAMLARYCRSSLADLWSTLNTATHPAVSSLPDLKVRIKKKALISLCEIPHGALAGGIITSWCHFVATM